MKKSALFVFILAWVLSSAAAGVQVFDQHGNPLEMTCVVTVPEPVEPTPDPDPVDPDPVEPDPGPIEPDPVEPDPAPVGAWTEIISSTAFKAVTPTKEEITAFSQGGVNIWGVSGPYDDVLAAWNSVSFDPVRGHLYAHGGGHTNYGGNEVYRADITAGTWERLTDPSPYLGEEYPDIGPDCHAPITGPPSTHTYAGVVWNPVRETVMLLAPGVGFSQPGYCTETYAGTTPVQYRYEFDPQALQWTSYEVPTHPRTGFAVYVPKHSKTYAVDYYGGQLVVDNEWNMAAFGKATRANEHTPVYDEQRDVVWTIQGRQRYFHRYAVTTDKLVFSERIPVPADVSNVLGAAPGIAMRNGLIWMFGGVEVVTYDPDSGEWQILSSNAPQGGRTYAKFHYWQARDNFVFVSDQGAVFLLDPNKLRAESVDPNAKRATVNNIEYETISQAVAASQDGDTITIHPGIYREAVRIDRNGITIKAEGVVIDGATYGNKATFVQYGDDLTIEGIEAKNLAVPGENAALVRMEPSANNLTLRGVYVHDSQAGFALTGKGTGTVLVEDSKVERTGFGGQAHAIYVGTGAERLIVRRTVFADGVRLGHLVKSRAPLNVIEDSVIDGGETNGSRLIDTPCGGRLEVRRTRLRQSPASDNKELIGTSLESCQTPDPVIVLEDVDAVVTRPDGRFYKSHQTVHVNCSGANSFEGIADPCGGH